MTTTTQNNEKTVPPAPLQIELRDWFAGQVACGMAAFSGTAGISYGPGDIAGRSYVIADALLEARGK